MCNSEFFSKYKIQSKLGEGTFSDVFKCENLTTGETVAVKKLKKQFTDLSEVEHLSELIALKKLCSHTNVLPLLEYIFDSRDGKLYMVFEVMEMSMYDVIQGHTRCLPESKVKRMFYQILRGVDHLHTNGILHRDIKPENILVKRSVVKLADLGSVRGVYTKPPYTDYISTRWYRAPECMLSAGFYGAKADVWACGCVYYEMLTSKPIFPGANDIDQLAKIHQITGTPSSRVLLKMRRSNARVSDVKFPMCPSTNFTVILPFTSDGGREILKRMLVYDPDVRTNVRRLLEHRYFNDLRRDGNYIVSNSSRPTTLPLMYNNSKVIRTNKSCNTLQTQKGQIITKVKTKEADTKLVSNSWAPSTNTANNNLTSTKKVKSKIASDIKPKYNPPTKTDSTKQIKQSETNERRKRILPAIRSKEILENKKHVSGLCYKSLCSKIVLPPILEQ